LYVGELGRSIVAYTPEGDGPPIRTLSIPYFSIRLTTICVERREHDVLHEFILRSIYVMQGDALVIGGFFEVEKSEIESEVANQRNDLFLMRRSGEGLLALTKKGIAAISAHGLKRIRERETACCLNGIARRVEQVADLMPRSNVSNDAFVLPAVPTRPQNCDRRTALFIGIGNTGGANFRSGCSGRNIC
jgi:hypothetical protein